MHTLRTNSPGARRSVRPPALARRTRVAATAAVGALALGLSGASAEAEGTRGLVTGATGVEATAARLALDACLADDPADPRTCVGEAAKACGAAQSSACLDAETAAWDALADAAANALSTGRQSDETLLDETREDVLAHRSAVCAAMAQGDAATAALCRRDKSADRTIVFLMLLSLEGDTR